MNLVQLMRMFGVFALFSISFTSFSSNKGENELREHMMILIAQKFPEYFSRKDLEKMDLDMLRSLSGYNEKEVGSSSFAVNDEDMLKATMISTITEKFPEILYKDLEKMDLDMLHSIFGYNEKEVGSSSSAVNDEDVLRVTMISMIIEKFPEDFLYEDLNEMNLDMLYALSGYEKKETKIKSSSDVDNQANIKALKLEKQKMKQQWKDIQRQNKNELLQFIESTLDSGMENELRQLYMQEYQQMTTENLRTNIKDSFIDSHLDLINAQLRKLDDPDQIDASPPQENTDFIKANGNFVSLTQIAVAGQEGNQCGANALGLACAIVTSKLEGARNEYNLRIDNLMDYRWNRKYFEALLDKKTLATISIKIGHSVIEESGRYGYTLEQCDAELLVNSWNYGTAAATLNGEIVPLFVLSVDHAFFTQGTMKQEIQKQWAKYKGRSQAQAFLINTAGHWFTLVVVQNKGKGRDYFVSDSASTKDIRRRLSNEPLNTKYKDYTMHSIVRFIETAIQES